LPLSLEMGDGEFDSGGSGGSGGGDGGGGGGGGGGDSSNGGSGGSAGGGGGWCVRWQAAVALFDGGHATTSQCATTGQENGMMRGQEGEATRVDATASRSKTTRGRCSERTTRGQCDERRGNNQPV
jgi:hypothetical protein